MSADTSTDKAPQATGKLEQTNPDYDPNIVIENTELNQDLIATFGVVRRFVP